MEQINLKAASLAATTVAYLVRNRRIENNGLYAEVQLTINGVVVPFSDMLQVSNGLLDVMVRDRAVRLLDSDEGLAGLRKVLMQARLQVLAAVSVLPMPPAKGDVDEVTPV